MKRIEVAAAVIRRGNQIFATQRGYGEWQGWWEFPGGKIEAGETPQQALIREIHEELGAEIEIGDWIQTIEWDYPTFHLSMHCYWCTLISASFHLHEHASARWLTKEELYSIRWLPADVLLLDDIAAVL